MKDNGSVAFAERTFAVPSHTEELDDAEEEEENGDPHANVDLLPIRNCDTSSGDFKG